MLIDVEGKNTDRFQRLVKQAVQAFDSALARALGLRVALLVFTRPHLVPTAGTDAPFDFLRTDLTEKLERKVHFLLVVTKVDLAASVWRAPWAGAPTARVWCAGCCLSMKKPDTPLGVTRCRDV